MKLGGFALKKGKRAALAAPAAFASAAAAPKPEAGKVFVTAFDPAAPAELAAEGQPPLVIPLVRTNEWQRPVAGDGEEEEEEEKAARAEDGRASPSSPPLAIPMAGRSGRPDGDQDRAAKRAELFQDADTRRRTEGQKPILQQNAVPGMAELADVTDKYRHDVALRPEAPDVHSDVYESVPVEAFGAALLRGMGWTGSVDADDAGVAPQPRHKLLGLGATKRPPAPGDDRKRRKKSKTSRKEEKAADAPARPPGLSRRDGGSRREDEQSSREGGGSRQDDGRSSRADRGDSRRDDERRRKRSRSRSREGDRDRGRRSGRDRESDRRSSRRSRSRSQSRSRHRPSSRR
ncbi:hypothetical protein BBJ28_00019498 [Nothophytophthora sp. Chile5]|nr:hypothetical protein BBJ28_00019498 [Nothophytophthora sp. Chile5]